MARSEVLTEKDDDELPQGAVVLEPPEEDGEKGKADEPKDEVVAEERGDSNLDVGGELDEDEREQRETSKERRERAKRAKERDRAELRLQKSLIDQLQQQLVQLTHHTVENRVQGIDAQIAAEQAEAQRFKAIQAAAIKAQNGEDAVAASQYANEAEQRALRLAAEKERLQASARVAPVQQRPQVAWSNQAQQFLKDKPWYDSNGRDQDSLVVTAIDKALLQERFDPRSDEFWEELEARTRKMLPHRFKRQQVADNADEDDDGDGSVTKPRTRQGPPVGGGRSSQGKPGTIVLSRERVQALKDAGLWDDPKTRHKMAVKYFGEWDKTNATANRRG